MAPEAARAGAWLDGWLDLLSGQGWRLGPRERLQVQALLARLAAAGELPSEPAAMLGLAGPLLCGNREQQRRYGRLLQDYVAELSRPQVGGAAAGGARAAGTAGEGDGGRAARWRRAAGLGIGAAVVVAVVLWKIFAPGNSTAPAPVVTPPASAPAASAPIVQPAARDPAIRTAPPWTVLPQPLPEPRLTPPPWSGPLRVALVALGALGALLLAGALWRARQRRMALRGTRSDEAVQHHLLYDPAPVSIAPHPTLARSVGRSLRQRMAGDLHELDLRGTLSATIRAHGALSPRWRVMQRMPEYLVLIERRHAADHQAAYAEAIADALFRAGVSLQVYHFDASPAAGCWARGSLGNADPLTRRRVPLAELAARSQSMRLLGFGAADAFINPATGVAQPWTAALAGFGERAWFTARPMADWGTAEEAADAAGFLVLPLQEASLQTLAGWLTAERLTLALDPDTPGPLPPDLRQAGLNWVTQLDAPPPEVQERLLADLRLWLGGSRFQWLCACAIFPAVTPPLTLALGRQIVGEGRALALGLSVFSALPWFRWGRMPAWLREALLERLSATHREQLQAVVQQRLGDALGRGHGPALADVATRVNAWLRRGGGAAQDLVLAEYLRKKDGLSKLAQRLPEALRKRLFRDGRSERGVRGWVLTGPAAVAMAGVAAFSPQWDALVGTRAESALPLLASAPLDISATTATPDIAFLSETTLIVGPPMQGNTVQPKPDVQVAFRLSFTGQGASLEQIRAVSIAQLTDEIVRMEDVQTSAARGASAPPTSGARRSAVLFYPNEIDVGQARRPDRTASLSIEAGSGAVLLRYERSTAPVTVRLAVEPSQRALNAVFTPSGSRVVALMSDGTVRVWGLQRIEFTVLTCDDSGRTEGPSVEDLQFASRAAPDRTGRPPIEIIRLTHKMWPRLKGPVYPAFGVQLVGRGLDADDTKAVGDVGRALFRRLQMVAPTVFADDPQFNREAAANTCPARPATSPPHDIALDPNADAPIAGLTPAQQAALSRRVDRMFGNDKADRIAATRELLADGDAFSDAITLALPRALRIVQPSRVPLTDARASGVVNTLVLLQQALPATLNRHRADIEKLVQGAASIGAETQKQAEPLPGRLQAAAKRRPIVYVQIADERQRAPVTTLLADLRSGFDVQPMELRQREAPPRPELRAVGLSDRDLARTWAARGVRTVGVKSRAKAPLDNDVYELWFDAGWCVTRALPACPGAGAAPSPALATDRSPVQQAAPSPAGAQVPPVNATTDNLPPVSTAPAASAPAVSAPTSEFVVEVFDCPSNAASSAGKSNVGITGSPEAWQVATALGPMGLAVKLNTTTLDQVPRPPATVRVLGYPAHTAMVDAVAARLRSQKLVVETTLTDIAALSPSEASKQAQAAGFKLFGVESRLLVVVCNPRTPQK